MNNKQSSIDFMHDAFMEVLGRKRPMTSNEVTKIWLQAKAMHKREIGKAYSQGVADSIIDIKLVDFNKYYNQTFGGHETN